MRWITDKIGYHKATVNIGVVLNENGPILVDTGIDNNAVNKVIKKLENPPHAALITHHHADHMGGANKIEKLKGLIYAPTGELALVKEPLMEPFSMFGGGFPPKILRNRYLEAKPVISAKPLSESNFCEIISSPGHTPDHQAFKFADVLYSGDAAFTPEIIEKYRLLFAVNPAQASMSIGKLLKVDFDVMIPGHGEIQESKKEANSVLSATKDHYDNIENSILQIIGEKIFYENYITECIDKLKLGEIIKNRGFLQYILYQVPLQGYLANLIDKNLVSVETNYTRAILIAQ